MVQGFGLLLVSILANIAGQFFLKIAGTKHGNVDIKDFLSHAWSLITTPEILVGMSLSVGSAIAYFLVLTRIELSIAGPASALIYVFSVAIGYYFFKEFVSCKHIVGLGLIVCGVVLVTTTR